MTKKYLIFFAFTIGITLRIANLNNVAVRSPDEQIYTYQAKVVMLKGVQGMRLLVQEYNNDKRLWIYPPPTRTGYLWLYSSVMKMTNRTDEKTGAYVSCAFSIITLALVIIVGLRFFNPWITIAALFFLSTSLMDLAISRRAWQDAMLGCLGLALVYLCCEITRSPKKIIWYILAVAIGSWCILIKESGAVIYGLCIVWILWLTFIKERNLLKGLGLMAFSTLGAYASILILARSAGGFAPLIAVLSHVKGAMPTNTYAIEYQTGPWYQFLQGFWIISPLNASLCLTGILRTILGLPSFKNRRAIYGITFFMLSFMYIAALVPYCQNLRYASALYGPFYLMSGLGLWYAVSIAKAKLKRAYFYLFIAVIAATIFISAAADYQKFQKVFVKMGILDVSIKMVKDYLR